MQAPWMTPGASGSGKPPHNGHTVDGSSSASLGDRSGHRLPRTLLAQKEASLLLNTSLSSARRHTRTGRVAVVKLPGGTGRYRPEDVGCFMEVPRRYGGHGQAPFCAGRGGR